MIMQLTSVVRWRVYASLFQKTIPHAQYFHCSNHDLNLALCDTCHGIPEVRNMLTCVTEIGLLFKYSPKRAQLLESIIIAENMKRELGKKMNTTKFKLFCETRWIQRHVVLEEIHMLYEPLLKTLEKITMRGNRTTKQLALHLISWKA